MADQKINVVISDLKEFTSKALQALTLDITANFQEDTPVDTGWARVNWVPNIGAAFEGTAGSRTEAEQGSLDYGPQQRGLSSILAYKIEQGAIHITNNVQYIQRLNEGSSAKAPSAFIQAGIERALSKRR